MSGILEISGLIAYNVGIFNSIEHQSHCQETTIWLLDNVINVDALVQNTTLTSVLLSIGFSAARVYI